MFLENLLETLKQKTNVQEDTETKRAMMKMKKLDLDALKAAAES